MTAMICCGRNRLDIMKHTIKTEREFDECKPDRMCKQCGSTAYTEITFHKMSGALREYKRCNVCGWRYDFCTVVEVEVNENAT